MITTNTIDMILDLWDEGHTPQGIADLIGITLGEVSEVLDVEGETLRGIMEAEEAERTMEAVQGLIRIAYGDQGNEGADPGDQDGDHETGLASVGWGTDEDYGYYGEDW